VTTTSRNLVTTNREEAIEIEVEVRREQEDYLSVEELLENKNKKFVFEYSIYLIN
jgi:hypothetical protein